MVGRITAAAKEGPGILTKTLKELTEWKDGSPVDLYNFIPVLNVFDNILQQGCESLGAATFDTILQYEGQREQLLEVLRFSETLLAFARNKTIYNSVEVSGVFCSNTQTCDHLLIYHLSL